MANWWDDAPVVGTPQQAPAAPTSGDQWWSAAPVVSGPAPAPPAPAPADQPGIRFATPQDGSGDPLGDAENMSPPDKQYQPITSAAGKAIDLNEKVAQGITMGFASRLGALADSDPVGKYFGVNQNAPSYADALEQRNATDARITQDDPAAAKAAEVGGSLLLPFGAIGKVAEGVDLGTRVVRGMVSGAGIGAGQAAGQVPDFSHLTGADLQNVGTGLGIGAGGGAMLPMAASGMGSLVRGLMNSANGRVPDVADPAREYLTKALLADDPSKVLANLDTLGPRAMPLDAGLNMEGVGQGLAVKDGPQRSVLANALLNRNATANDTVQGALDSSLGPATSPMQATLALRAQRAAVHDQLPQVFSGAPAVDTSDVLSTIGQGLTKAVGPEKAVLSKAKDYLMQRGPVDPDDVAEMQALKEQLNSASPSETSNINEQIGALKDKIDQNSLVPVTDAEKLNGAKMAIDKLIDYGDPGLGVAPGAVAKAQGAIGAVRKQLNGALRDQVPGYGSTMDASSSLARQIEQIEQGTKTLGDTQTWPTDFASTYAAMSPSEQAAHQIGMRSNFQTAVTNKENDLQAVKSLMQGANGEGGNAQKVAAAFGQPASDQISSVLNAEQKFRDVKGRILDNSQTAQRQAMAKALADGQWAPKQVNLGDLSKLSVPGMVAGPAQWAANKLVTSLQKVPDNALRDMQLARATTAQGPEAQALIRQLMMSAENRAANANTANNLSYATMLLGGLSGAGVNAQRVSR